MFRGKDAKGDAEVVCIHALKGEAAARLSMDIIRGVSYTTLEGAKALVAEGLAKREDFWVFVGYAGWAPKQLQGEVDRDSWFLASADSGTLLKELLRQGTELPSVSSGAHLYSSHAVVYLLFPPCIALLTIFAHLAASRWDAGLTRECTTSRMVGVIPSDGLATWEKLMTSIGRTDEVTRTRGSLSDRVLSEWCRVHLLPRQAPNSATETDGEGRDASAPGVKATGASVVVVDEVDAMELELTRIEAELAEDEDEDEDEVVGAEKEADETDLGIDATGVGVPAAEAASIREMAARMVEAAVQQVRTHRLDSWTDRVGLTRTLSRLFAQASSAKKNAAAESAIDEHRAPVPVGTVLRSGQVVADRFLLSDQFLHKAILVTLLEVRECVCREAWQ